MCIFYDKLLNFVRVYFHGAASHGACVETLNCSLVLFFCGTQNVRVWAVSK